MPLPFAALLCSALLCSSLSPHALCFFPVLLPKKSPPFFSPTVTAVIRRRRASSHQRWVGDMSCNGCRVLRKGCSETCLLRSCLQWITTPEAQGNATLFLAKFFGRSDLLSLISAVPESQRPALFQSLLFEACGRTVNPVNGAVGLLWSGNWHLCQAAVETVLSGGTLQPLPGIPTGVLAANCNESSDGFSGTAPVTNVVMFRPQSKPSSSDAIISLNSKLAAGRGGGEKRGRDVPSFCAEESEITTFDSFGSGGGRKKLLNLFV